MPDLKRFTSYKNGRMYKERLKEDARLAELEQKTIAALEVADVANEEFDELPFDEDALVAGLEAAEIAEADEDMFEDFLFDEDNDEML